MTIKNAPKTHISANFLSLRQLLALSISTIWGRWYFLRTKAPFSLCLMIMMVVSHTVCRGFIGVTLHGLPGMTALLERRHSLPWDDACVQRRCREWHPHVGIEESKTWRVGDKHLAEPFGCLLSRTHPLPAPFILAAKYHFVQVTLYAQGGSFLLLLMVHRDLSRPVVLMLFLLPTVVGPQINHAALVSESERKSTRQLGKGFLWLKDNTKK